MKCIDENTWQIDIEVKEPVFVYKYIIQDQNGNWIWQEGQNRLADLTRSDWIINDYWTGCEMEFNMDCKLEKGKSLLIQGDNNHLFNSDMEMKRSIDSNIWKHKTKFDHIPEGF